MIETKNLIESEGIPIVEVSTGTTGTYDVTTKVEGVTEVQAGTYALMATRYHEAVPEFDCALSILSTVISRPSKYRAITDSGLMSINASKGLPTVVGYENVEVEKLSAENATLKTGKDVSLKIGDKAEFLPSYLDGTVNLFDVVFGLRRGKIESVWRIAGRGRSF